MKHWFKNLSLKQQKIMYTTLLLMIAIIVNGVLSQPPKETIDLSLFTVEKNMQEMSKPLGVTGKSLAKELGLSIDADKTVAVKSLGIDQKTLAHAAQHLLNHKDTTLKYYIYTALTLGAIIFLLLLGRPEKLTINERKSWYPLSFYLCFLGVAVITTGFLFGKSPNPMEGAVKLFKTMAGLYPDPLVKSFAFIFFLVLAIIGNKVICGWTCPFGALEELLYSLPFFKKIKSKKLPFNITNAIRSLLFVIMLLFLFGVIGGNKGMVIYHYVNTFNIFNFDFELISITITITLMLLVSLFIYRPFCQLICPFGFLSWIVEKISFARVTIDFELCTKCGACSQACPTEAAEGIVEQKKLKADCFSCTRCLKVCPVDAIKYKIFFQK